MKRRALKLLLFLLVGGTIINVAVAWGCALWLRLDDDTKRDAFDSQPWSSGFSGIAYRWTRSGAHRVNIYTGASTGRGPVTTHPLEQLIPSWGRDFLNDSMKWNDGTVDARGWPCLALWGGIGDLPWNAPNPYTTMRGWMVHGAIPLEAFPTNPPYARSYRTLRLLPYALIWPGFAINTIFYAAVLWVLFAVPMRVRRWRRIKRGQCASCGYSLRGTPDIEKCPGM